LSVEDTTIPSPLDIFQRFPNGASLRDLVSTSRAFRRFADQVLAGCHSQEQRVTAWAKVGVEVFKHGNGKQTLRPIVYPAIDQSQVDPAIWKEIADEIAEAEAIGVNALMRDYTGTPVRLAIEAHPDHLPKPLADLWVIVQNGVYRIGF
jgi:hypothetical protein